MCVIQIYILNSLLERPSFEKPASTTHRSFHSKGILKLDLVEKSLFANEIATNVLKHIQRKTKNKGIAMHSIA